MAAVLLLLGAGALFLKRTPDTSYPQALRDQNLGGQFSSDAAVAYAKAICNDLTSGGKQQGSGVDLIAVTHYCPDFAQGFKVLQTKDMI